MAVLRYVVPAMAAVGYAAAASSCTVSGTTTLSSAADATAISACRTFSGSIALATSVNDQFALDGVEQITGDFVANGITTLTSLSGDSLTTIGGQFLLEGLTILTSLTFPLLTTVDTIAWTALANLQGLSLASGLQEVSQLTVSDTELATLEGINLKSADQIEINNNRFLKSISMQLVNITTSMDISSNGPGLTVSLPNLLTASNMTIRDASSVTIPSLASVGGLLGFYSNDFQSLTAPNLTSVAGTLAIDDNSNLANASFPELKTLKGGLQVQNNNDLANITGFPSLQSVSGAVLAGGDFVQFSLPALTYVHGDFNISSTQDITAVCSHFMSIAGPSMPIQGTFSCSSKSASGNVTAGGSSTGTSSGTSTTSSSSAAHPILISGATGLLGVVAAIFGML